ncbi:MAG: pitrilysin family protein [Proteobacteria bacterium]|nr:pitrilysin family protein [Pseudomonadota bacterium]
MNVQVTRLPGGLTVATDPMPGFETASVGVWVAAGARNESLDLNGVSHLLEHMAFKGTKRRTAQAIAEEIEAVGGHLNAYTSRELTAYYARVLKDDVPLAIDLLADILQHSSFDESELARERDVVVQEIGEAHDTPDDVVFDLLQEVAFPDQPLGRTVLGTPERVSGFRREQLSGYLADHYAASRMVIAAAGAVDHDALCELAAAAFADLAPDSVHDRVPARYRGGEVREERDLEQVHLTVGFPSLAYDDPDYTAAQVFSTVLGGGMSSRLFQEVREKRGLAYSIFAFSQSYQDVGLFGIYAGTSPQQVDELLDVAGDQLAAVCEGIDDIEAARARAQHKAAILMSLESSSARAEQLARQLLIYGRPIPPSELAARIDAVDTTALSRVARRITAATPSFALVGPGARSGAYDRLAARFGR